MSDALRAKRRKRPCLVCENCRKKKIKCDKASPCLPCTKAGLASSCAYSGSPLDADLRDRAMRRLELPYEQSARNPIEISVAQRQPRLRPPAVAVKPEPPNDATAHISKTELQVLKERLQQIEDSISKALESLRSLTQSFTPPTTYQIQQLYLDTLTERGAPTPQVPPTQQPPSYVTGPGPHLQSPPLHAYIPALTPTASYLSDVRERDNSRMSSLRGGLPLLEGDRRRSSVSLMGYPLAGTPNPAQPAAAPSIQLPPLRWQQLQQLPLKFDIAALCRTSRLEHVIGVNPYFDTEERINLFTGYTSIHTQEPLRRINNGPFAWSSLMRRDRGLNLLWEYMILEKRRAKERNVAARPASEPPKDVKAAKPDDDYVFLNRAVETEGYGDMVPYDSLIETDQKAEPKPAPRFEGLDAALNKINCAVLSANLLDNALSFSEPSVNYTQCKLKSELYLVERIQAILPKRKVIWKLLDRFFAFLYPFFPCVDEECFLECITPIIGERSYTDTTPPTITVGKRLDLAYLGILLVIMRLSYLLYITNKILVNKEKLYSKDPCPQVIELKYFLANKIPAHAVVVAQLCLDQFLIFRVASLAVLQLGLFLRFCHTYAPEDGDGADGGDSQVFNGMLLQMAYSLGLHREPDHFPDVCNNARINHLGRKIFQYLCIMDLHQGFTFGNPISVDKRYYDVKTPYQEEGVYNISNHALDRMVTKQLNACAGMWTIVPVLQKLLDARDGCNISEVCQKLGLYELEMQQIHGNSMQCFEVPLELDTHDQVFLRNFSIKFKMALSAFFMSVYFHFYLYYEGKNNDLSFYYVKKMLLISTGDIMPHYFDLLGNKEYICDMLINPTLQQFINKANQLNLALIIRINFVLYHFAKLSEFAAKYANEPAFKEYYDSMLKLSRLVKRSAEISICAILKLSNRYYYAWRITKGHTFQLKTVMDIKFYDDNYAHSKNLCEPIYTLDQVKLSNSIVERTVNQFEEVEVLAPDFCACSLVPQQPDSYSGSQFKQSNIGDFNVDFVNNAEIDQLWIQMISLKYDTNQDTKIGGNTSSTITNRDTPPSPAAPSGSAAKPASVKTTDFTLKRPAGTAAFANFGGVPQLGGIANGTAETGDNNSGWGNGYDVRHGFDLEELARFDIFNDLPLEQVFLTKGF